MTSGSGHLECHPERETRTAMEASFGVGIPSGLEWPTAMGTSK